MHVVDEIFHLYDTRGREGRPGGVGILDHALQAAHLAERESAPDSLVTAALLHDIGHLLDRTERGIGDHHEEVGCAWLGRHFPAEVTEPICLHVRAKRYLCTRSSYYKLRLPTEARRNLDRQGGLLEPEELDQFGRHAFFIEALRLRRWIDVPFVPDLRPPGLEHYRPLLESIAGVRVGVA